MCWSYEGISVVFRNNWGINSTSYSTHDSWFTYYLSICMFWTVIYEYLASPPVALAPSYSSFNWRATSSWLIDQLIYRKWWHNSSFTCWKPFLFFSVFWCFQCSNGGTTSPISKVHRAGKKSEESQSSINTCSVAQCY